MKLTKRQAQIVRLMADGLSDRQAASRLRISPRTVRFHIDRAKEELQALNRPQLVARAMLLQEITLADAEV